MGEQAEQDAEDTITRRARWQTVSMVAVYAKNGELSGSERQSLLDALGHGDCVSREHQKAEYEVRSAYLAERDEAVARAERAEAAFEEMSREHREALEALERAERERDEANHWLSRVDSARQRLAADNERLREALRDAVTWIEVVPGSSWLHDKQGLLRRARAALSADAEPCDCEPIRYPLHLSNSWTYAWEHQPDCATRMAQPDAGSEPGIKSEGKGQMENIGPTKEPPPPPTQEEALEYYQHVSHHFERGATSLCRWCGRPECTPLHID